MSPEDRTRTLDLVHRYQQGDQAAGGLLVKMFQPYLERYLITWWRLPRREVPDILQEMRIGFLEQCRTFDPTKGAFISHVFWGVRSGATAWSRKSRLIDIPNTYTDHLIQSDACRTARALARQRPVFLDDEDDEDARLAEGLPLEEPTAEEQLLLEEQLQALREALEHLDDRQQHVLKERFEADLFLAEIGEQLGVSRERARQIEAQALARLRDLLRDATPVVAL